MGAGDRSTILASLAYSVLRMWTGFTAFMSSAHDALGLGRVLLHLKGVARVDGYRLQICAGPPIILP